MRKGWTLDNDTWRRAAAELTELEYKSFRLEKSWQPHIPEAPGVYLMCVYPPTSIAHFKLRPWTDMLNVVYVGHSENLRRRFGEHVNGERPNVIIAKLVHGKVDFWFCELPLNRMWKVEQLLIDILGPTANEKNSFTANIGRQRSVN